MECERQKNLPIVKHHENKYSGRYPVWGALLDKKRQASIRSLPFFIWFYNKRCGVPVTRSEAHAKIRSIALSMTGVGEVEWVYITTFDVVTFYSR